MSLFEELMTETCWLTFLDHPVVSVSMDIDHKDVENAPCSRWNFPFPERTEISPGHLL